MGELSAINGIAGAYSERVPLIHIVGVPSTKLSKAGALLHHTLGDGSEYRESDFDPLLILTFLEFDAYRKAAEGFSAAQAILDDVTTATAEIDRVIRTAIVTCKPVYISLPTDFVFLPVDASPLEEPLLSAAQAKVEGIHHHDADADAFEEAEEVSDQSDQGMLTFVMDEIVRLWSAAKRPVFLVSLSFG